LDDLKVTQSKRFSILNGQRGVFLIYEILNGFGQGGSSHIISLDEEAGALFHGDRINEVPYDEPNSRPIGDIRLSE
jgi:hypothetical protein